MSEGNLNLARNLLLKDDGSIYPRTGDFRPMVSSAVWVKRLRRDKMDSKAGFRMIGRNTKTILKTWICGILLFRSHTVYHEELGTIHK